MTHRDKESERYDRTVRARSDLDRSIQDNELHPNVVA